MAIRQNEKRSRAPQSLMKMAVGAESRKHGSIEGFEGKLKDYVLKGRSIPSPY